jgi:imidazolonepropionase-like amidohydrolase
MFEQSSLDLMTAESRRRSLPSAAHVLATESVRRAALARFDSLEHCAFFERLPNGLINRNYDDDVALVLRDSGSAMMANLSTAMPTLDRLRTLDNPTDVQANSLRQFDKMIDNFGKLLRLGVPMICGNDAGVNETPFDTTWFEVVWMIKAGQSPVEALRSATIGAAKALLIDHQVGRLEKTIRPTSSRSPAIPWKMRRTSSHRVSSWRAARCMSASRWSTPDGQGRCNGTHAVGARPERSIPHRP